MILDSTTNIEPKLHVPDVNESPGYVSGPPSGSSTEEEGPKTKQEKLGHVQTQYRHELERLGIKLEQWLGNGAFGKQFHR
jgi:hypothetical protein